MKWIDDRAFSHFHEWECWQQGILYETANEDGIRNAIEVLSSAAVFATACDMALELWPTSTAINLSDRSINRRAWLGRAGACVFGGASGASTRFAWWQLTDQQRNEANEVADRKIEQWEKKNLPSENCPRRNAQLVFQF